MGCTEASIDHYVEGSAAISQTACADGFSQPDIGMTSCIEDEAEFPMIAIAGGVAILAIAAIFMQSQKKPKSPKKGKRRPPKGKRRRPPQGKRKRPKPAKETSTEASQEEE
tara:strand:+ start:487 stop:819 length:333 start_codon:yes stop_codon:yes gene_type:complete